MKNKLQQFFYWLLGFFYRDAWTEWSLVAASPMMLTTQVNTFNTPTHIYLNNQYQVEVYPYTCEWGITQLVIITPKKKGHVPWSHIQRIKNELFGKTVTGVEVFPSETHRVKDVRTWLGIIPPDSTFPLEIKHFPKGKVRYR